MKLLQTLVTRGRHLAPWRLGPEIGFISKMIISHATTRRRITRIRVWPAIVLSLPVTRRQKPPSRACVLTCPPYVSLRDSQGIAGTIELGVDAHYANHVWRERSGRCQRRRLVP